MQTSPYKGSGQLTREQFMFHEMRITARLLSEGMTEAAIIEHIYSNNLYQYPTEKSLKSIARSCLGRLHALGDNVLVEAIAHGSIDDAKQICLYAMMRRYRLVHDFMLDVIGTKYQQQDYTFSRRDVSVFMLQVQAVDSYAATWTDLTVRKICGVLLRMLRENGYIDSVKPETLNPVLICPVLEDSIRRSGNVYMLPAFNCLS